MKVKVWSSVVFSVAGLAILCGMTSFMSPNRYMPLHWLALLSKETNRNEEALKLAQQILEKEIKIPSSTVHAIRNEMQRLIENSQTEKVAPEQENRTHVKPFKTQPRQDDLSEKKLRWDSCLREVNVDSFFLSAGCPQAETRTVTNY
jgi:hypothetical protein